MKYVLLIISLLVLSSFFIALSSIQYSQNDEAIIDELIVVNQEYATFEDPVLDKLYFKHDFNVLIDEQLLETCKTFRYGGTIGRTANNRIVGAQESVGNCVDYAVHFVWNWNKKHFTEMPAFVIIYSNYDKNSRGYYTIYSVLENNTQYKGMFGNNDDFHYYSMDGERIYYGIKVSDIKVPIIENHAWAIIMTQDYDIIVDPQETDHLGYSKTIFIEKNKR